MSPLKPVLLFAYKFTRAAFLWANLCIASESMVFSSICLGDFLLDFEPP